VSFAQLLILQKICFSRAAASPYRAIQPPFSGSVKLFSAESLVFLRLARLDPGCINTDIRVLYRSVYPWSPDMADGNGRLRQVLNGYDKFLQDKGLAVEKHRPHPMSAKFGCPFCKHLPISQLRTGSWRMAEYSLCGLGRPSCLWPPFSSRFLMLAVAKGPETGVV